MTTPDPAANAASALRGDFRSFLYLVWKHCNLPDPTAIQYDIAKFMQRGPKRRMVKAFRGVGKSWIAAAYVLWRLYNNPQLNILVVSANKQRSDAFTTFCQRLILEMPLLAHLKARSDQRWSMVAFDVGPALPSQSPSVMSVGVYGNATGMRADIIVPDDIEVANNSETLGQREKLAERVKEFDAILKPDGEVLYLGTDQTEESVYQQLPARGYTVRLWPVRYPDEKQRAAYDGALAPWIDDAVSADPTLAGRSTEPARFTDLDIAARELSYGRAGFALQFMLDPRLSDVDLYPLKMRDLIVHPLDHEVAPERLIWSGLPEYAIPDLPMVGMSGDRLFRGIMPQGERTPHSPWQGTTMYVDPAGRGKDEVGYAVVSMLNGLMYLRDAGGLSGYGTDTLERLAEIAKRTKTNLVLVEPNFGDGMFTTLLKPVLARIHPVRCEDAERAAGQKEKRIIDTLEPVLSGHRLVVDRSLIQRDYESTSHLPPEQAQKYRLFYQMTRITRHRGALTHDDRLDALAGAVRYWADSLARDVEKAADASRERERDKRLREFGKLETWLWGGRKRQKNIAPTGHNN